MAAQGVVQLRLERLADARDRTTEKLTDLVGLAEEEERELNDFEKEQAAKYRQQILDYEEEITLLATDLERVESAKDVSRLLRQDDEGESDEGSKRRWATPRQNGPIVYRTFAQYARDRLIIDDPRIASLVAGSGDTQAVRMQAEERLQRALENVTSSSVEGLVQATHMTQIMDIVSRSRPVVSSGRAIPLDRGSLTYPKIDTRADVQLQSSEKSQAGSAAIAISTETVTAQTYLGATNISWQAANWSSPDVLSLWFDLAAEEYARQTEEAACDVLEDSAGIGTVGTASGRLGTAGTESFSQWRTAVSNGISGIYTATGGRHRTDTLYLSAARFFQLATLGTDQVTQMSPVGALDVGSMTGTFFGLRVVGSYGFDQDVALVGDSSAFLVGENAGNPVEMRVVEPSIGGYELGLIGAFKAAVFDTNRFYFLSTHL